MATHLKLPYGLQNGRLVHITQVANGLACACICPGCKARLIARNGGKRKVAHFAHYKALECTYGLQTALHLAAKDIILKHRLFRLPGIEGEFEFTAAFCQSFAFDASQYKEWMQEMLDEESAYHFPSKSISVDNVILECKTKDIIPDIILETPSGPLLVEIAVTHFIDDIKLEKIKQLGTPTIEIDLSNVPRDIDLQQLEVLLIDGVAEKRWIYNSKLKARLALQRAKFFELARPHFEQKHAEELARQVREQREQQKVEERHQYKERQKQLREAHLQELQQQYNQAREKHNEEMLLFYATQLKSITLREFENGTIVTAVKHITSCPIAGRTYNQEPYSSVDADCRRCQHFRGYWHQNRAVVCLSAVHGEPEAFRFRAIIDK